MKSDIFLNAIRKRNNLKFLYGLQEVLLEPYYITRDKSGKKVIYGRVKSTHEIKKFDYHKIANIRTIESFRFSPIIPIANRAV
jgi:hypothetical protein